MSDLQSKIRVANQGRDCPYCKERILDDVTRCVCNKCLAVVHMECWDQHRACPSCNSPERLVQEAIATLPAPRPAQRSGAVRARAESIYDELRESSIYQDLASAEGRARLIALEMRRFRTELLSPQNVVLWIFCFFFASGLLVAPTAGFFAMLGWWAAVGIAAAIYVFKVEAAQRLALQAANLHPIPVQINSFARSEGEFQLVLMQIDPDGTELPDDYYEMTGDPALRIIGIEVPHALLKGLNMGQYAVLVARKKRAVILRRIEVK